MTERLIAIGDIHGCFDQFRTMVEENIHATKDDRIILIGDYIDRGSQIREVIDYIINLQEKFFNIIPLLGNHELMLLNAFNKSDTALWLLNGGAGTLNSFGIKDPKELDDKYIRFFKSLFWYYEFEKYLFVHAGFNDGDANPFEDKISMVWTRRESYTNPKFADRIIIHGHTPITAEECQKNVRSGNRVINIDTGCVYDDPGYGTLTAIELRSNKLYFV